MERAACGSWSSPIAAADLAAGALRLAAPQLADGVLHWLEGRPSEGGRQVVMTAGLRPSGGVGPLREGTPRDVNVRSRVHEYGGGAYAVGGGRLFFVDDRDGLPYWLPSGRADQAPETGGPSGSEARSIARSGAAHADLVPSPDGRWLVAVQERPRSGREPENRLVAYRLPDPDRDPGTAEPSEPVVVAAGHDFYASPTFSPRGDHLAWLAWDHPHMPWTESRLEQRAWSPAGPTGSVRWRAGGSGESLFQPRFAPDGGLFVVSDRGGWWNLARVGDGGSEPLHRLEAELGRPQWVFGLSTWAFDGRGGVLASATRSGLDELVQLDPASGSARTVPTPFCQIEGLQVDAGRVACLAGSARRAAGIHVWRLGEETPRCVREGVSLALPEDAIAPAEARSFPSLGGRATHAFLYRPLSTTCEPIPGERPPLLVMSHGGPTAATRAALDPRIQYWTSRGFAVADVNYGGSTGFGRAYRELLAGAWGIVDVEDCVAVARALAEEGVVDGGRLAITGRSAGGYTTLCALTFHDVFAAGASHYGIGDLEALARDTHKFESRYTDWLVGELPRDRARYVERSPVHHPERLARPVIFFQGLEDRVVPPSQAEAMVRVLAARGLPHAYVAFEGEQHGFRRAENIRTALEGELYFYGRVFGFATPRPPGVEVQGGEA